jgi:hypothetical protein
MGAASASSRSHGYRLSVEFRPRNELPARFFLDRIQVKRARGLPRQRRGNDTPDAIE